ncbi:PspC domain-containing protein [Enterococcus sp. LJL98]
MQRKLTKSKTNVVFTGTLAGIAEYLNIDPTIIRIIYVFISLVGVGSPIILYIIMAVLIPSGKNNPSSYGHDNRYYRGNQYQQEKNRKTSSRKEAEKVDEDDWSDF